MRGAAAAGLVLALHAAAPAHARAPQPVPAAEARALPPPPPGTERLIRIGPQAVVAEDARGRVRMADEPAPPPHRAARVAVGLASMFVIGVGVFLALEGQNGLTLELNGPVPNQ